jgi:hypothetical protein
LLALAYPKLSEVIADFATWANGDATNLQTPAVVGLVSYLVDRFPCPYAATTSRGRKR